jgi:Domain of Unknown Function (DUF1259)
LIRRIRRNDFQSNDNPIATRNDDNALVDGDFVVLESELQPVLKSLRKDGINIVAIHQHMTGENPRYLFLHYWGRGVARELAQAVKNALDQTAK